MRSAADGAPSHVWVPGLAAAGTGSVITIAGDEAHYLRRVVRVRAGERVTATDGAGTLADLEVADAADVVRAEVRQWRTVARPRTLELWCGAPEGDRADWLVEKLGELGVAALRPVNARRGAWERAAQRRERWQRLAIAALRQSRSAHRLEILPPIGLAEALAARDRTIPAFVADPAGPPFGSGAGATLAVLVAAVGPSGGFSDDELKALEDNGFRRTGLGGSRLRTETAALAVAALALAGGA